MSFVRIWIHAVFSTYRREAMLEKEGRYKLFTHIKERAKEKDIYLDYIGGYTDHIHLLISLGKIQNIADVMHQIKGESSFWANKNQLFSRGLKWQDDYFAVSVSHSHVDRVRKYIAKQEEHHSRKTYEQEVEEFLTKYEFDRIKDKE